MNHKLGFGLNIDDKERTIRNEIEPIQSQYFITSNTKESVEKFETFLPVIFVVLFLLLLFVVCTQRTNCPVQASTRMLLRLVTCYRIAVVIIDALLYQPTLISIVRSREMPISIHTIRAITT